MPTARWPNIYYDNLIKTNFTDVWREGRGERKVKRGEEGEEGREKREERERSCYNMIQAYSILSAATLTGSYTATLTDPLLADAVKFNMANEVKVTASFAYALPISSIPPPSFPFLSLLRNDNRAMYYTGTCIVTSGGSGKTTFNINCAGRDGWQGQNLSKVYPPLPSSPLFFSPSLPHSPLSRPYIL